MNKEEKFSKETINKHRQMLKDIYQQQSFRLLIQSVKDYAIYMIDKDGYVMSWNDGAENIKGYKANEIVGEHFSCFYTKEEQQIGKYQQNLAQAESAGHFQDEGWRLRKDGSRFWASVTISPLKNESGELLGFTKVTQDMSERKRAEEKRQQLQLSLQTAAKEWELTFNAVDFPVIILDNKGKILRSNDSAALLLAKVNLVSNRITNHSVRNIGNKEPWKKISQCIKFIRLNHVPIQCQVQDPLSKRTWDISITFAKGFETQYERLIVVVKDITKLVELQESLRHSEIMSALGVLVAGVAHEVRNPLFSMSATLDAFEEDFPNHPEYSEYLDILHNELNRLTRLMKDLLEYGKPSKQKLLAGSINTVIFEAIKTCERLSKEKNILINSQVPEDLPLVLMDETRLVQVFQNLLDNAIHHSPNNTSVLLLVNIVLVEGKSFLEILIQDCGSGFAKEDLQKVFDPFFSHRPGGTGLGLSIVQRILEEHQGRIILDNNPLGGARVKVLLPIIKHEVKSINVEK